MSAPQGFPPELAAGLGALLGAAITQAKGMADWPACERRPWGDDDPNSEGCGAVLLANVDDVGGRHVHYCRADLSLHLQPGKHACVCGVDWVENTSGVAEVVGPNETIVRPGPADDDH